MCIMYHSIGGLCNEIITSAVGCVTTIAACITVSVGAMNIMYHTIRKLP